MKKFFAFLAICITVLMLSSCALLTAKYDEDLTHDAINGDSTLNINLVSYLMAEDDNTVTKYQLQIGIKSNASESSMWESKIRDLEIELAIKLKIALDYIKSFTVGLSNGEEYIYYCFDVVGTYDVNIKDENRSYGFFYMKLMATITNPEWINSLRDTTYSLLNNSTGGMAPSAVRLRYFYITDNDLKAENATQVQKTVLMPYLYDSYVTRVEWEEDIYQSLMWEADDEYNFTSLSVYYRAMAPGWYIVPILLGVIVVALLIVITKNKAKNKTINVFRQDVKDDCVVKVEEVTVLDGQISMDELKKQQVTENNLEGDNAEK